MAALRCAHTLTAETHTHTYTLSQQLPKAHVKAPIEGSVILAGVVLKLGGYGIIQRIDIIIKYCIIFNIYILSLNLLGVIFLRIKGRGREPQASRHEVTTNAHPLIH